MDSDPLPNGACITIVIFIDLITCSTLVTPMMTDTGDGSGAPTSAVSAMAVKLPPFWPSDPDMWFTQVGRFHKSKPNLLQGESLLKRLSSSTSWPPCHPTRPLRFET